MVVCDVKLPGTSGTEWAQELRRLDPELPVILITGHGDIAMAVQAMREGAYDFIEKPCSSERLVSVVRRAAEKRRLVLEVLSLRDAARGLARHPGRADRPLGADGARARSWCGPWRRRRPTW